MWRKDVRCDNRFVGRCWFWLLQCKEIVWMRYVPWAITQFEFRLHPSSSSSSWSLHHLFFIDVVWWPDDSVGQNLISLNTHILSWANRRDFFFLFHDPVPFKIGIFKEREQEIRYVERCDIKQQVEAEIHVLWTTKWTVSLSLIINICTLSTWILLDHDFLMIWPFYNFEIGLSPGILSK